MMSGSEETQEPLLVATGHDGHTITDGDKRGDMDPMSQTAFGWKRRQVEKERSQLVERLKEEVTKYRKQLRYV